VIVSAHADRTQIVKVVVDAARVPTHAWNSRLEPSLRNLPLQDQGRRLTPAPGPSLTAAFHDLRPWAAAPAATAALSAVPRPS
jgi:hypothetical protein